MIKYIRDARIPADNQLIWRYMNVDKFRSIVEKGKLFFPTITLLRDKIDPAEGSWANFIAAQAVGQTLEGERIFREVLIPLFAENASQQQAVSCWHVNDSESKVMWEGYVPDAVGVAVQTTFGGLKDCFLFDHPDWPTCGGNFQDRKVDLLVGQVEYIDWANPPENATTTRQVLFKTDVPSYRHENELRITAQLFPLPGVLHSMDEHMQPINDESLGLSRAVMQQIKDSNGVFIPVDINKLAENIYIAPNAPSTVAKVVEDLRAMYGLSASMHKSIYR